MKAWKALIRGRVQNVGFRHVTKLKAQEMGFVGTVRNLSDGSVEIILHGRKENLEMLIEELKKRRFPAHVDEVIIEPCEEDNQRTLFEII